MTQAIGALVAIALSSIAGPVLATDMPIGRPLSTPAFSWTSCHLGAHVGGGWARKSITDPAQLVREWAQRARERAGAELAPLAAQVCGKAQAQAQPLSPPARRDRRIRNRG